MGIDRTQALKREKAKAEKFRSITKDLNQTRLDASARFKRGDRVTNGKQTGTVDSINPTTGDVMVRVRGRSLPMNPEFLTHES